MKRAKKWLAAGLCVLMSMSVLTGCGKAENKSGLDPDAVVLTVGEDEVSLQEAYFMLKWQQSQYQTLASAFYGDDWYNVDLEGNGETFLDYIKSSVMELLEDMYLCRQEAKKQQVTLTEDEQKAIDDAVKGFFNSNTKDAQAAMMADEETVYQVLESYAIYNKMYNEIVKDADTSVSEEEAQQKTYSYIYQDLTTVDEDGNRTEYTDAQKQEYYTVFSQIAAAAKESGDFDQAAQDGGYQAASHPYLAAGDDDDSFKDINNIAEQLEVGEVSDLIPVEGGLFLIRKDSENDEEKTQSKRESMAAEKQAEFFESWLSPIREAAGAQVNEELWNEVGFEEPLAAVVE